MMTHKRIPARLLLLLALALWPLCVRAEGLAEAPPFQVASVVAPAEVPAGGEITLTVSFKLRSDVHAYKSAIKFQWDELKGATQKEVVLPKGKLIADPNAAEPGAKAEAYEGTFDVAVKFQATGAAGERAVLKGSVGYQGCTETMCYRPMKAAIGHEVAIVAGGAAPVPPEPASALGALAVVQHLLKALLAGLLISLTPCVYPMIPITMAVIGGRGERSKLQAVSRSAVYVLGIAVTYAVLGLLVATLGASVRSAFQSPYVLVPVAALFVVLALGMFDILTIQAPASWGSVGEKLTAGRQGVAGALLLGAVSGLVAGPCVAGPLLGMLLEIARIGSPLLGAAMMFTLAWGMGAVLIAAGVSTGLLPKAGKWTVWVKKLFGFILLWAAVYFVRPVVGEAAYWLGSAAVVLAGAVFLGCLDALTPESSPGERAKRVLGWAALFAAAGMALAGLGQGTGPGVVGPAPQMQNSPFVQGDPREVDAALGSGRPVVLDFTAEWCGYCKVLDRTVFADPRVVAELQRFRAFKIDVDDHNNAALAKRYDVPGPPLVIVFDAKGQEARKLGYDAARDTGAVLDLLKSLR